MNKNVEEVIRDRSSNGKLVCNVAWKISDEWDVPVKEIGQFCNENDIKIVACELGCF